MNPLDQDEELKKIIEHAKALREECLAFNRSRDYTLDILSLYNNIYSSRPVRINIENMPKEGCKVEESKTHFHYYYDIGNVECWDTEEKGGKNG